MWPNPPEIVQNGHRKVQPKTDARTPIPIAGVATPSSLKTRTTVTRPNYQRSGERTVLRPRQRASVGSHWRQNHYDVASMYVGWPPTTSSNCSQGKWRSNHFLFVASEFPKSSRHLVAAIRIPEWSLFHFQFRARSSSGTEASLGELDHSSNQKQTEEMRGLSNNYRDWIMKWKLLKTRWVRTFQNVTLPHQSPALFPVFMCLLQVGNRRMTGNPRNRLIRLSDPQTMSFKVVSNPNEQTKSKKSNLDRGVVERTFPRCIWPVPP